MSGQYFDNNPSLKHDIQEYQIKIDGKIYRFLTDSGVFSRGYLDFGSKNLIESFNADFKLLKALDLGCGYGPIGIILKSKFPNMSFLLVDINQRAVDLAKENAKLNQVDVNAICSDGFDQIEDNFNIILLNPPIRAGKETIFNLYEQSFKHLYDGGELWIVIQKKQGAASTLKKLETLFSKCEIISKNKGYFIYKAKKTQIL